MLACLLDGDPLELAARCRERVRGQAILLDVDRLHLRVVAHVAHDADLFSATHDLGVWIAEQIRKSVRELADEDRMAAFSAAPVHAESEPLLNLMIHSFGIDAAQVRRGIVAFNEMPFASRSAFFALFVDQQSALSHAKESGVTLDRVRADVRRALRALGLPPELDGAFFDKENERE